MLLLRHNLEADLPVLQSGKGRGGLHAGDLCQLIQDAGALGQLSQLGGLLGKSNGVSETATSAVSNVANTDQLNSAFTALGMQDGMVAKFAPVLLDYFKGQNVSTSLLSKLSSAWGV